jgi:hypothetical protein
MSKRAIVEHIYQLAFMASYDPTGIEYLLLFLLEQAFIGVNAGVHKMAGRKWRSFGPLLCVFGHKFLSLTDVVILKPLRKSFSVPGTIAARPLIFLRFRGRHRSSR